jgi:hypothetical protein
MGSLYDAISKEKVCFWWYLKVYSIEYYCGSFSQSLDTADWYIDPCPKISVKCTQYTPN